MTDPCCYTDTNGSSCHCQRAKVAEAALATARADALREAADLLHKDQVNIWADEVLEYLAHSDVLAVETYEDKITAADQLRDGFMLARTAILALIPQEKTHE